MIRAIDTGDSIAVALEGSPKDIAMQLAAIFNAIIEESVDSGAKDAGAMVIGIAMRMSKLNDIAERWKAEMSADKNVLINDLILAAMKEARGE